MSELNDKSLREAQEGELLVHGRKILRHIRFVEESVEESTRLGHIIQDRRMIDAPRPIVKLSEALFVSGDTRAATRS